MTATSKAPLAQARAAGALYLAIIVLGIFSEVVVRSPLLVEGDAAATAANIATSDLLFRVGFLADSIMVLCDVALAVLLYGLFEPVSRTLSLMAATFRLIQAALLGTNLLHYHTALLLLNGETFADPEQVSSLVYHALDLHRHGYDLGLIFFGANCLVLGHLALRANYTSRLLGFLLMGASLSYFLGSYTRFLFPGAVALVAPIYLVAIIAEVAFCAWLLAKGAGASTRILEENHESFT